MMMMTYATHNIAAPHQTYFKWGEHTFSIRIGGKRRRSRPWLANCDLGVWASTWCGGPVDCYRLIRRELRAAHCICTALGPAAFRPTVSSWRLDFLYSVDDRVNYACFECICAPSVYPLVVWSARFAVAALALCAACSHNTYTYGDTRWWQKQLRTVFFARLLGLSCAPKTACVFFLRARASHRKLRPRAAAACKSMTKWLMYNPQIL